MAKAVLANFFNEIRHVKRVLVVDLGLLGDTIQIIPALGCIRKALPDAQLEVIVSSNATDILKLTPWLDKVHGYQRFPKRLPWYKDIAYMLKLWGGRYDLVINFTGSDRSSRLTWVTRAPYRLIRKPNRPDKRGLWKYCATHTVEEPFDGAPLFEQNWRCLRQAGFPGESFAFEISVPIEAQQKVERLLTGEKGFINVSPFSSENERDLPLSTLAAAINEVRKRYPEKKWVISCAPTPREKEKLAKLLGMLDRRPDWVFDGTLKVVELAALIQRSALHLGAGSGALHIARLFQVPAVCWIHRFEGLIQWMPKGPMYRSFVDDKTKDGLINIRPEEVAEAVEALKEYWV